MRLVEELSDDDPRLPVWFGQGRDPHLGVGKLQFDESPFLCGCGHTAGVHFEMWPAYRRVTGDRSYTYLAARPLREGCDECVDCVGLRIDMDNQGNMAALNAALMNG